MKKVKYLGPRDSIEIQGFGPHGKGQTKEYPDEVAEELVRTARRQRFEPVGWQAPGGPTAAQNGAEAGDDSLAGPEPEGAPGARKQAKAGKNKGQE